MSSYLRIYVKSKDNKYNLLCSFSRNNNIYQVFYESNNIAYAGNEDIYTLMDEDFFNNLYNNLNEDIIRTKKIIIEYEKYTKEDKEFIQELIGYKDYLEELNQTKNYIDIFKIISEDASLKISDFTKIYCNIV